MLFINFNKVLVSVILLFFILFVWIHYRGANDTTIFLDGIYTCHIFLISSFCVLSPEPVKIGASFLSAGSPESAVIGGSNITLSINIAPMNWLLGGAPVDVDCLV